MGTHPQGSTLRYLGDPLVTWLRSEPGLAVQRSAWQPKPGDHEPARATFTLSRAGGATRSWLLAESCWTNAFEPVSYLRIAGWLIGSVPWMLGDYFRTAVQRESEHAQSLFRVLRLVLIPIYAVLGALLSGPAIIALAALLFVRMLNIPFLKAIPGALARSLGDVYVILASEVDRQAIRCRIVRDYAWLTESCDRTVIVAHSAGAALTHGLIRDGGLVVRQDSTYVTLGEAAWRMTWMSQLSDPAFAVRRVTALLLAIVGTVLLVGGQLTAALTGNITSNLIWLGLGGLVMSASVFLVWSIARTTPVRTDTRDALDGKVHRWRDYVASSDPVPAGPLSEQSSPYEPVLVRNSRSVAFDHTGYPKNLEEFVSSLAWTLDGADEASLDLSPAPAEAVDARRLRTLSLALVRLGSTVVAAIALGSLWAHDKATAELGGHVTWLGDVLRFLLPHGQRHHVTVAHLGLLLALVLLAAPWVATRFGLWSGWNRSDRGHVLARDAGWATRSWSLLVAGCWLVVTTAGAFATMELGGTGPSTWWLAVGVALMLTTLALALVKNVADWRDAAYRGEKPSVLATLRAATHAMRRG